MASAYDTDDERWTAVRTRDAAADGVFVYGVLTTGIYCHPSCPSKTSLRENTRFYGSASAAREDGLRACRRCLSDQPPLLERQALLVRSACDRIASSRAPVRVEELAGELGISRFHLQRLFRQFLGISPKQYIKGIRAQALSRAIEHSDTLSTAIFDAGYDSSSAYYAEGAARLGMSAKSYRQHGKGLHISYAFGQSRFGSILVASTDRGICSVLFGDSRQALLADLQQRFRLATLTQDESGLQHLVERVIAGMENPELADRLPLDVRGTAFQEQVWTALRKIAAGSTASYAEIAAALGRPSSARAVASACAANPVAVLIPCHRVVGASGKLSGYRWGIERKKLLLENEAQD